MKVGYHTEEHLHEIINRKMNEISEVGFTFWGYGGTVCHPTKQVQKFVEEAIRNGCTPTLVMIKTKSPYKAKDSHSSKLSVDGKDWSCIPEGIRITGSNYALKCRNLTEQSQMQIDLFDYKVGIGSMSGSLIPSYFKYRVDKACAILDTSDQSQRTAEQMIVSVSYTAELVEPFAVFVR